MKELFKWIVVTLIFIGTAMLVTSLFSISLEKQDRIDCEKLLSQSKEYPLFYLTLSEKNMCDYLGVTIEAPVK